MKKKNLFAVAFCQPLAPVDMQVHAWNRHGDARLLTITFLRAQAGKLEALNMKQEERRVRVSRRVLDIIQN